MRLPLDASLWPLRIMKNSAEPRLATMPINATTTRYFMEPIIP